MQIEKAAIEDAEKLTILTKLSKNYWNYGLEQIERWSDDLTITSDYIEKNQVFKLCLKKKIVGYFSFFKVDAKTIELDNLFVHPNFIGKGFGKVLMEDFLKKIKNKKGVNVILYSEPRVELFYKKFGFEVVGKKKTSIKGRYLPIMTKALM